MCLHTMLGCLLRELLLGNCHRGRYISVVEGCAYPKAHSDTVSLRCPPVYAMPDESVRVPTLLLHDVREVVPRGHLQQ